MSASANGERLLRKPDVAARVGLSTSQIDRLERQGQFPRRVPLGANSVAWPATEIAAWVRERIEARDTGAGNAGRRAPVPPLRRKPECVR